MGRLGAVIFDVDGTLADTERDGHRPAFNAAFRRHGLDFQWAPEEYGRLLAVTGGQRRVGGYLRERGYGAEADALAARIHATKTELFVRDVTGGRVPARAGVRELVAGLRECGVRVAVATTGSRAWVEPLLDRVLGPGVAEVVVTGEQVRELKPHPEAYRRALEQLGLPAAEALAVEDSEVGLRAALAAGLTTVVVSNGYTRGQDFTGAAEVRTGYHAPDPLDAARCARIHAAHSPG